MVKLPKRGITLTGRASAQKGEAIKGGGNNVDTIFIERGNKVNTLLVTFPTA